MTRSPESSSDITYFCTGGSYRRLLYQPATGAKVGDGATHGWGEEGERMRRLLRRQVLAYVLGLATALAGFAVGAAWAGRSADTNTITACASKNDGSLYLFTHGKKRDGCDKGDSTVTWGITVPQGPIGPTGPQGPQGAAGAKGDKGDPGTFSNAVSPNGLYTVSFGDRGITLKGPAGSVTVSRQGAHILTISGAGAP